MTGFCIMRRCGGGRSAIERGINRKGAKGAKKSDRMASRRNSQRGSLMINYSDIATLIDAGKTDAEIKD